jgi:DNA-binding IclR family transcriptional regulator
LHHIVSNVIVPDAAPAVKEWTRGPDTLQRQSPPTERVTRLLDLLATRPQQGHTLSELARELEINKATCLGIVGALCRAGYLVRDESTKTYTLGPSLVALGRAASDASPAVAFARPELQRLNDDLGFAASLATRVGDDIVIVDRTGPYGELDRMIRVGQRYPYAPPSGMVMAAWLADDAIERWLDDHAYVPMAEGLTDLRAVVDTCRAVGYFVERMSDISLGALTVLAGLDARHIPAAAGTALRNMVSSLHDRNYVARDLRTKRRFAVTFVAAPSWDASGRPDLLFGALVLRDDVTRDELVSYGDAVMRAAARVTELAGGHNPWTGLRRVPKCRVGTQR